jgi:anaerobic sulfite reductase subunit B
VFADHGLGEPTALHPGYEPGARALTPVPYRVISRRRETDDVTTLCLAPVGGVAMVFRPGQFNMLTAFGVGEAAISISSAPTATGPLEHTVRDVGTVTHSLCAAGVGDLVGVRGPFGTDWGLTQDDDLVDTMPDVGQTSGTHPRHRGDIVVVAGGIGLAPLRGAVYELLATRRHHDGGRVFVCVGARDPAQVVFHHDLEEWRRAGASVSVTVDVSAPGWSGHVGLVTSVLGEADFDPAGTTALVCGPEIMMRFTARALTDRGVDPGRIRVSLERNMQCGVAWCGHCQLGPFLLCRDGPVLPYAGIVTHLLTERER